MEWNGKFLFIVFEIIFEFLVLNKFVKEVDVGILLIMDKFYLF